VLYCKSECVRNKRNGNNVMNDKFWDLKKEKQDRMINAALKNFAKWGYKKASTDEIVKDAGISKGLLFHYFGSKQGLYTFIYEYSARYMEMEYSRSIGLKEDDFFEIQKQLEQAKLKVMRNYPYMNQFLNQAFMEKEEEIISQVEQAMDRYSECIQSIYAKVSLDKISPQADPSMLLKVVILAMDGLRNEQFKAGESDPDALYEETMQVLDMFKAHFYRA